MWQHCVMIYSHTINFHSSLPSPSLHLPTYSFLSHQLILCREYTRAEDQDWHLDHFCCLRCDQGLGGQQYRPQDGQPYCLKCYEIAFASICEVVKGYRQQLYIKHDIHRDDACPLPPPPPPTPHPTSLSPSLSLQTCGKQVTLDQARLNHGKLVWHGTDKCFVCAYCSTSLLGQPYLPREEKVFCSKEHAKKFKAKSKKQFVLHDICYSYIVSSGQ